MYFLFLLAITLVSTFFLSKLLTRGYKTKDLPGGSLGFPLIGETFSFLRALKKDKGPEWINERVSKYGTVFKTSLMGTPTVVIFGQAGNKFVLGSDEGVLAAKQPKTLNSVAGKYNFSLLTGSRYKLLKGAILSFFKPESLQNYVKQMDDLVKNLLLRETKDRDTLATVIFMKKLTFTFSCSILFGIHDELTMKAFFDDFTIAFKAFWSLPLYFPGTVYWNGLRARTRIINRLRPIIRRRKEELSMGLSSPKSDLISCLLALKAENEGNITEEMIMDNFVGLMIASHDTTSILLSLMVWKMSRDTEVYQKILEEQMGILENREGREEKLTWVDIQKMKYTWRVAQELMRIIPPLFGSFRNVLKDTTFGGYVIPKGWQVFSVVHSTHMDKDIFDNPMEFDPSRFENLSKRIPPYAYVPFGGGLHMCIGNEFTRVETLTMVHSLVTLYEWVQVHPEEMITRQPVPYPSMGLPIKIKPRTTL